MADIDILKVRIVERISAIETKSGRHTPGDRRCAKCYGPKDVPTPTCTQCLERVRLQYKQK